MPEKHLQPVEMAGDNSNGTLFEITRLAHNTAQGSIPRSIKRLRRGAASIGASTFALFFTGRGSGATPLVHCFDEQFPRLSDVSTAILVHGADALAHHAASSALPACWRPDGGVKAPLSLFLSFLPVAIPGHPGVAFPVCSDAGQAGLVCMTGAEISGGKDRLMATHQLCYEIFATVSELRSSNASSANAVSKRELECLRLTASGRTSDDISRILGLSVHTANQHLTSVCAKLDAVNRMQAVAKAIRQGLID